MGYPYRTSRGPRMAKPTALSLMLMARAVSGQIPPVILPDALTTCRGLLPGETYSSPLPPALPPESLVYNNLGGLGGADAPDPPAGEEWPHAIRIRYVGRHPDHPNNSSRWVDAFITNSTEYVPIRRFENSINRLVSGWMSLNLEGPEHGGPLNRTDVGLRFQMIDGATPDMATDVVPLSMGNMPGVLAVWDLDTEGNDLAPRYELNGRECVSAPVAQQNMVNAIAMTPDTSITIEIAEFVHV